MLLRPPSRPLPRFEFIALMAMTMATIAFSTDAMLPALSEMAQALTPEDPVRIQLVVLVFMIGMGVGTLFSGPLSDAYGRRPILLAGGGIFCVGALLAVAAPTLEVMLLARAIQGLGASASRVISMAMVRDCFSGRAMAQTTSLILTVFMIVPALAPAIGAGILWLGDWHAIFLSFLVFAGVQMIWFALRQPETLDPAHRRPIRLPLMRDALKEIVSNPLVRRTVLAMSLTFGMLMTMLSSTEMVFEQTLGLGHQFPIWFGLAAITSLVAPLTNARLVMRLGMHRIACWAIGAQVAGSAAYLGAVHLGWAAPSDLLWYFLWQVSVFMTMSLSMGNLNALVMEPLGHVAGTASSLITSVSTVLGALIAIPAAAMFDGTQVPLLMSVLVFMALARVLLSGQVFRTGDAAAQPARHVSTET